MKKKFWLYFCILIALVLVLVAALDFSYIIIDQRNLDLKYYITDSTNDHYYSDGNTVPDAQTAAKIGSVVIDNMCNNNWNFGFVSIDYDVENRLWKVAKGYLLGCGGMVVIDQDTGEIVKAFLSK